MKKKFLKIIIAIILIIIAYLSLSFYISLNFPKSINKETALKVERVSMAYRVADVLLWPMMFVLGGFDIRSIQNTHPWHVQEVDADSVSFELATEIIVGDDASNFDNEDSFLFHAPIFGGWKNYTVYEVGLDGPGIFLIGWIQKTKNEDTYKAYINKLPINGNKVRMLNGSSLYETAFFATNKDGIQIPIHKVGGGVLGDGLNSGVPLY